MSNRPPADPDAEIVPAPAAARLFARASELDAVRGAGTTVTELRATAAEAGISGPAFEAALAEMQDECVSRQPEVERRPRGRGRIWAMAAGTGVLIMTAVFVVSRIFPTPVAGPPVVEEAIQLRCLTADQAAQLVRPLLSGQPNVVVTSSARAPGVLNVRGTSEQITNVRSVLDGAQIDGSTACASLPASRKTP